LEVVENGVTKTLPAVQDTYVSAGDNKNTNYGDAEILYAREEATRDAAGNPVLPVSTDTKRPYFRFNMNSLSGNVTSIKFKFYAKSDFGTKKLFVFTSQNENSFNESELTWLQRTPGVRHYTQAFNCKQTGFLYPDPAPSNNPARIGTSGDPDTWNTEYEWINYNTRLYPIEWLVARYRATGDEAYAENALDFLNQIYIKSGNRVNQGASYPRDLEGAWRTEYLCHAFFGTLYSDSVTPEILVAELKYIYAHLERFLVSPASTAANQNSAARIGALRVQAYFPEIRTAAHWTAAKERLKEMYIDGIGALPPLSNPDGSYTEATSGYMDGTVNELAQCLKMLGTYDGLEDPYYKLFTDTYNGIIEYMLNMCFPYGLTPGYGDGGRGNLKGFLQNQLNSYENPYVRYFTSGGASGEPIPYTSKLFPDKAAAFLKDGWNAGNFGAFINADHGGSHSHSDDLALDVSAYGVPLLVDAGNTSYSPGDPMLTTAAKTLSHNTVEIANYPNRYNSNSLPDGDQTAFNTSAMRQDPQRLSLSANKLFDFVSAGSETVYSGYDINRRVLFLHNKYWIVNDLIIPPDDSPNTYKQAWHPDANAPGDRGALADINPAWDLYPSLNPKPEPINKITVDPLTKAARSGLYGPNIQIVPATPEELEARKEQYYQATPKYGAVYSNYISYVRENAVGPATFDAVLYPDPSGVTTPVTVQRINMPDTERQTATALEINAGGNTGHYYTSYEETPAERDFGEYAAEGEMAYIETDADGKITMAAVTGLSSLKKGGVDLIISDGIIKNLGVEWNGATINLYAEDGALPESNIKIYSETPINKVKLNGEEISFAYDGNTATVGYKVDLGNGIFAAYQPALSNTLTVYSAGYIGETTVIAAIYDENSVLSGVFTSQLEITAGKSAVPVVITGLDIGKHYKVKLMLWNNFAGMAPAAGYIETEIRE
jgi:antitoxin component YwqK of YwqJK toxin-antitoxin module